MVELEAFVSLPTHHHTYLTLFWAWLNAFGKHRLEANSVATLGWLRKHGLHGRNHFCPKSFAFRHLCAGKMIDLHHSWPSLGAVVVISLSATVIALTVQRFVGTSATSIIIGPLLAAALAIIYLRCQSAK